MSTGARHVDETASLSGPARLELVIAGAETEGVRVFRPVAWPLAAPAWILWDSSVGGGAHLESAGVDGMSRLKDVLSRNRTVVPDLGG
jgi:hypothetical protein